MFTLCTLVNDFFLFVALGAKPISGGAKAESKESVVAEKEMSLEEAEEMCAELLGPQLIAEMADTNWKVRLSALEQFLNVRAV